MITAIALGAAKFLVETTASFFIGKGLDKLLSRDEFQEEFYRVINTTLEEYEEKNPVQSDGQKFPFYHSQQIVNELFKISIFKEDGDVEKIIDSVSQNERITTPTNLQITELLEIFYKSINENEKLTTLNIEMNYKAEIFEISTAIQQIQQTLDKTIANISTDLTAEWKRQLDVYKSNLEQFKPKTALELLIKLEIAISESDTTVSKKIESKLHYQKGLCYELLMNYKEANKEFLLCYSMDSSNFIYKEKAARIYYSLDNLQEAKAIATEIIQLDKYNPFANFILQHSDNEEIIIESIRQLPKFVTGNQSFKFLLLHYVIKGKKDYPLINGFLKDMFIDLSEVPVTFDNLYTFIHEVEYLNYRDLISNPSINFAEGIQSTRMLELIHSLCQKIVNALKGTEIDDHYQYVYFLFYLTDYIVDKNPESLDISCKYFDNENINGAIMLASCLQASGNVTKALDILTSIKIKYPEIQFFKAFCNERLGNIIQRNIEINKFISQIEIVSSFNFVRILPIICSIYNEESSDESIDIKAILDKKFELEIFRQIFQALSVCLDDKSSTNFESLFKLASDSNIPNAAKSHLALLLLNTNNPDLSVELYRQFVDIKSYNRDLYNYILALDSTKNAKELLALLKSWRENSGQIDVDLLKIEYSKRRKLNDWKESLEIMKLLFSKYPYHESIFSNYFVCLQMMNEFDKIAELKDSIFSIKFSSVHCVSDVVNVLAQNNFLNEAFELLYPLASLRDNTTLRMLFLRLCLLKTEHPLLKKYDTVQYDCYVLIEYDENKEKRIINIKNEPISEMQRPLLGQSIGSKVQITVPTCNISKGVNILDIMNKYLALNYEIYHELDNPIDTNLPMTSFKLPENYDAEMLSDFFIKAFASNEEKRKNFISEQLLKYKNGEIQFSVLTLTFQSDFINTYYVITDAKYGVLLNPNLKEMSCVNIVDKEFVLDFPALLCFYEFGKSKVKQFQNRFIISKFIFDFVSFKIAETKSSPKTEMALDISATGLKPIIYPSDYKEQLLLHYEGILEWIKLNCEVEIIEERLDILEESIVSDMGDAKLAIEYIADYLNILNQPNRILISDDAMLHMQYGRQNREISSQLYLSHFFDENEVNTWMLERNYFGVPFDEAFLKNEFVNKLSGKENNYSKCLDSMSYLLPLNKVHVIRLLSSFLKDIYTDSLVIEDLNRETINLFVCVLRSCINDVSVFNLLKQQLTKEFYLLGSKQFEVLMNLIGAIKILLPRE